MDDHYLRQGELELETRIYTVVIRSEKESDSYSVPPSYLYGDNLPISDVAS